MAKEDLIFHLVPEKRWKEDKLNSEYRPASLEEEGFIHCSSGGQVQETANHLYKGERRLLLLVINPTLVSEDIKYEPDDETGETYPHIYGPLNVNAVVDKIRLLPEENGSFEITYTAD